MRVRDLVLARVRADVVHALELPRVDDEQREGPPECRERASAWETRPPEQRLAVPQSASRSASRCSFGARDENRRRGSRHLGEQHRDDERLPGRSVRVSRSRAAIPPSPTTATAAARARRPSDAQPIHRLRHSGSIRFSRPDARERARAPQWSDRRGDMTPCRHPAGESRPGGERILRGVAVNHAPCAAPGCRRRLDRARVRLSGRVRLHAREALVNALGRGARRRRGHT